MSLDVSVVIPTFRRPDKLVDAVRSVVEQQGVSLEVIVLDDCPDGSAAGAVASIRDARVQYLPRRVASRGRPAAVRNAGWRLARGRFVHFLDDDDIVPPGTYRQNVQAFDAHPERGVLFGRIQPFGQDAAAVRREQEYFDRGAVRVRRAMRLPSRLGMTAIVLFGETPFVNSACMVRRECIEPLGGYDPELPVVEDVDFYVRAIRRFGYVYADRVVIHYRFQADSLMHNHVDRSAVLESYRVMFSNYRAAYGLTEFMGLKILARTAFRGL
jgi:glycosyltransferase involved in cell wall biosynthesis